MIGHLTGRLLRKGPQEAIVDVGGVGYRVTIPISTFYRLGEEGSPVSLRIHTHVREDALALFGFVTETEEDLFGRLIGVAGVGPKLAVNILSGIEAVELTAALRASDLPRLTRIPGVGKKTAERLVLELKDKLPAPTSAPESTPVVPPTHREDLYSALGNLGYSRGEAERAIDRALRESGEGRFEDLLRTALQALSRR
ncbi:MAG TPA: Holliday junction branch migration protein RuvA [Vicinamibacteria bacterium]|jgi:Holliday junction DNA helicase RuvA|nr:Holliday junction branch migration protein RuvA [Vicinamibacteria bacterium]